MCFYLPVAVYAQRSDSLKKKPSFKISLNYSSNLNYYGRTDSLKSQGLFPQAELWVTPDFYINAAPVFVSNTQQRLAYAGTVTTIGYQNLTDKWLHSLYLLKPFYQAGSTLPQSTLRAQAGGSITRLTNWLNVTAGVDVKRSNQWDLGSTASIDHIFTYGLLKNIVVIDPTVAVYSGTQQFSKTYVSKKKGGLLQPPTQQMGTKTGTAFVVLAYEASLPLVVARGKWQVLATPSYIMPQHLLQVAGHPELSEQGSNLFYTTLALKHTF